jgi:hypothetical protein
MAIKIVAVALGILLAATTAQAETAGMSAEALDARDIANQPVPMVGEPERTLLLATACFYIMNPTPKPITQEEMALLNNPEAYRAYAMRQGIPQDVTREMKRHADGKPCIDEDCDCTEPEVKPTDPFVDWSTMKNFLE